MVSMDILETPAKDHKDNWSIDIRGEAEGAGTLQPGEGKVRGDLTMCAST